MKRSVEAPPARIVRGRPEAIGLHLMNSEPSNPPAATRDAALSPSLADSGRLRASRSSGDAYEIKFVFDEALAREVERRLSRILADDPHADPTLGGAYAVTSLYCDTPAHDVYFREGRHAARKYRVRRYGDADTVYLERKTVKDRRVRKRRCDVPLSTFDRAIRQQSGESEWFARQVAARNLAPLCRVRYLRRAMFGVCPDGPMRVTFDRSIRGALVGGWSFDAATPERVILDGLVIGEFKFTGAMPAPMKAVAAELLLSPSPLSKYRACAAAFAAELGLPPSAATVAARGAPIA